MTRTAFYHNIRLCAASFWIPLLTALLPSCALSPSRWAARIACRWLLVLSFAVERRVSTSFWLLTLLINMLWPLPAHRRHLEKDVYCFKHHYRGMKLNGSGDIFPVPLLQIGTDGWDGSKWAYCVPTAKAKIQDIWKQLLHFSNEMKLATHHHVVGTGQNCCSCLAWYWIHQDRVSRVVIG